MLVGCSYVANTFVFSLTKPVPPADYREVKLSEDLPNTPAGKMVSHSGAYYIRAPRISVKMVCHTECLHFHYIAIRAPHISVNTVCHTECLQIQA